MLAPFCWFFSLSTFFGASPSDLAGTPPPPGSSLETGGYYPLVMLPVVMGAGGFLTGLPLLILSKYARMPRNRTIFGALGFLVMIGSCVGGVLISPYW